MVSSYFLLFTCLAVAGCRSSAVMECMAVITHRGNKDGCSHFGLVYALEGEGRLTTCFVRAGRM